MLQADEPDTYVLATNRTETVRDFASMALKPQGVLCALKVWTKMKSVMMLILVKRL